MTKREPLGQEYIELGKRLRELRQSRGMTLKDVAPMIGMASNTIGEYECGQRRANMEILKRFAEFYGVSGDELLGIDKIDFTSNSNTAQRALWLSEFADEHFTVLEVKQIIDYAKYLIYKRGERN